MAARPGDVLAVVVAHDGARWLPRTLAALAASSVRPAAVVGVDTGSTDGSGALLEGACDVVLPLAATTGLPAAVSAAVAEADAAGVRPRWLWLLHDDSAPARDCLATLLGHAAADPAAVLLGPGARDWDDPGVLVEVGLTVDAGGHRDPGVEPGERDQGQRDAPRAVLAVGTAGALVRRDVWDRLGGLDPALPLLLDDVDLGWRVNAAGGRVVVVPRAAVAHARALTTGRRRAGALRGADPEAVDRRHALQLRLAHAPVAQVPGLLVLLVLACLARAVGLLLGRQPAAALAELRALGGLLARPGALLRARRLRAVSRRVPASALRPLFARRRTRLQARLAALADRASGGAPAGPLLEDPDVDPDAPLPAADGLLRRPGVLLALALTALALVAGRDLLPGTGPALAGGALLPAPPGAADLWAALGREGAPPLLAVVALLGTLLLGDARLAVDVLLLLAVPLAGVSAYLAAGALLQARALRLWGAATWALLPPVTGAVAQGRLGLVVLHVVLPPLLLAGARLLGRGGDRWRRAWLTGLLLTVATAAAPAVWPLALGVLLAGALVTGRRGPAALALGVPVVLLAPSLPGLLPPEAGEPVRAAALALLHPGGPGLPPAVLSAGLLLAALGGPVPRRRRRAAVAGWGLALAALLAAGLLVRAGAHPGAALSAAGAGLLVAAAAGGDGLHERLRQSAFGTPQVLAGAVALLAALTPALLAGAWVLRGADGPLTRDPAPALPPFVSASLAASPGDRALLLGRRPDGRVGWTLVGAQGATLGAPVPTAATERLLAPAVADLVAPRGADAAAVLAGRRVRWVALRGADPALTAALDGQRGLSRRASGEALLWQVVAPAAQTTSLASPPDRTGTRVLQGLGLLAVAALALPSVAPRRSLQGTR